MHDSLHWTVNKNKQQSSAYAAEFFASVIHRAVKRRGSAVIVVPTGSSPKNFYEILVAGYAESIPWENVFAYSLDELVNVPTAHSTLFRACMDLALFSSVAIPQKNIVFLNSNADNFDEEAERFEESLRTVGGIDITILGVGSDGHIGMNFPGSSFTSTTRKVPLPPHARPPSNSYSSSSEVPTHGITTGIATILSSRTILLIVDGASKREALEQLCCGIKGTQWPVTALQDHPEVHIFAAQDSISERVARYLNHGYLPCRGTVSL